MVLMESERMASFPLRFGTESQFATVRQFLLDAGFTAAGVAERLEIPSIFHFKFVDGGRIAAADVRNARDALIRLFVEAEPIDARLVERHIPAPAFRELVDLGLLSREPGDREVRATVALAPADPARLDDGLWLDRDWRQPIHVVYDVPVSSSVPEQEIPSDLVFAGIGSNTGVYLATLPRSRCGRFLEACGGTGVAALMASSLADEAVTADIAERATRFAEFNVRLNGTRNVRVVQGDLYEPVSDRGFDRIAAHPPYVPSRGIRNLYADGGDDGEFIIRRILGELHTVLNPGGVLYLNCATSDRETGQVEDRLRAMLGPATGEFDLLVLDRLDMEPIEFFARAAERGFIPLDTIGSRFGFLKEFRVQRMVYATIVVRRLASPRPVWTIRRNSKGRLDPAAIEWLLDVEDRVRRPSALAQLLDRRALVAEESALCVWSQPDGPGWTTVGCTVNAEWPFSAEVNCPPWTADFLRRCDGARTVRDAFSDLVRAGRIGEDAGDAFLQGVGTLMSAGVLALEGAAPPPLPPVIPNRAAWRGGVP